MPGMFRSSTSTSAPCRARSRRARRRRRRLRPRPRIRAAPSRMRRMPAAHQRVIVGEAATARLGRRGHDGVLPMRNVARRGARRARCAGADGQRAAERGDPLAHAEPAHVRLGAGGGAAAVVLDGQTTRRGRRVASCARTPRGARVAGDVGQRFLHDAVDHHFDLRREAGGRRFEVESRPRCATRAEKSSASARSAAPGRGRRAPTAAAGC